jgi:hypothetical protein
MNFFLKGERQHIQTGNLSTHRNPTMKAFTLVAQEPRCDTPPTGVPAIQRSVRPKPAEEGPQTTPLPPAFELTSEPASLPAPESSGHTAPLQQIPVPTPEGTTSTMSVSVQVTEGAREMAQQGVNAIFRTLLWATDQKVMNRMERRDRVVFLLLDGRRTIRDIAQLVHRNELDIARTIVRLLKSGYIAPGGTFV